MENKNNIAKLQAQKSPAYPEGRKAKKSTAYSLVVKSTQMGLMKFCFANLCNKIIKSKYMSDNIVLGIDPGVGSIGLFRRDASKKNIEEQLLDGAVLTFPSGVISDINSESYAVHRGDKRRQRNHNLSRKQCKWATLELLIKNGMCPLSIEELDKWRKYDKDAEVKHPYPAYVADFVSWLRCDFNNDGKPDYKMLELRNILAINNNVDLSTQLGKQILGRVVYHMALHRGFRSSKGERATENQEDRGVVDNDDLIGAEEQKAQAIKAVMEAEGLPTVGSALYFLNVIKGERIRESVYTIIAKQNKQELRYIFDIHTELGENRMLLCNSIIKTVFRVKPIPSQKERVAKCLFEKGKTRSPKSRPEFEEYRAWSFINNIRVLSTNEEIPVELKSKLYEQSFWSASYFKFEKIKKYLSKELENKELELNYSDDVEVAGCPIMCAFKKLLGDNWRTWSETLDISRVNLKPKDKRTEDRNRHNVVHTWETLWNKCYTGDIDDIEDFCKNRLNRPEWTRPLLKIMSLISKSEGYSHISTAAIKKINVFLRKGYVLDKAILLAKIPDIIGNALWKEHSEIIENEITTLYYVVKESKVVTRITNNLIDSYKKLCLDTNYAFAISDTSYKLDESDKRDIKNAVSDYISDQDECYKILCDKVEEKYQQFFASSKRTYIKALSLRDVIKTFLADNFNCDASLLYDHAVIEKFIYHPEVKENINGNPVSLLGEPRLYNLKNPVVLRTMYKLRNILNYMLLEGKITNDTQLVVETAKNFNDANMRYAVYHYQEMRKKENEQFENILASISGNYNDNDVRKARFAYEQSLLLGTNVEYPIELNINKLAADIKMRYKLWTEQKFRCIYTGRVISLAEVLNGDNIDIEHTLPLSRSMDDSDENKTLCDSYFNRHIKQNKLPHELSKEQYDVVCENIKLWEARVEFFRKQVQFWPNKAKKSSDKENKNFAIRNMHIYRMEYNYWQGKVSRFKMEKIESGFVHRQLSDTRAITRYLVDYLRVVFPNVSVQNSHVTTAFREILGLPEKSRDNNLHHAVDAAILSMIPSSYVRDKLLELYYQKKELNEDIEYLRKVLLLRDYANDGEKVVLEQRMTASREKLKEIIRRYNDVKTSANLNGDVSATIEERVDSIVVNYLASKRVLNKTRKKYRARGKVVVQRDENGNVVIDNNGKAIPWRWCQGSSVRGEICKESFYGKIKVLQKGDNNKPLRNEDGSVVYEEKFVKREPVNSLSDVKKLIQKDCIVDKNLKKHFKRQIDAGNSKYPLDQGGNKVRHIRCFTSNGVIPVKEHRDFASKHLYKNQTYCENGTNAYYAVYENKNQKRVIRVYNLIDLSKLVDCGNNKNELFPLYAGKKDEYTCKYVLEPGIRVIMQQDRGEHLLLLDRESLAERLYVVNNFRDEKDGRVYLKHHTVAKTLSRSELKSNYSTDSFIPFLVLSRSNLNFWVEGYDFDIMPDGEIKIRNS